MCFPPELQQTGLLELHLGRQAVRGVSHRHDAPMVDVKLAHYDIVDRGRHLHSQEDLICCGDTIADTVRSR